MFTNNLNKRAVKCCIRPITALDYVPMNLQSICTDWSKTKDPQQKDLYNRVHLFLQRRFNSYDKDLKFKPLNKEYTWWLNNLGDTIILNIVQGDKTRIKVASYETSSTKSYSISKLNFREGNLNKIVDDKSADSVIITNRPITLPDGTKLNRAYIIAKKFCPNVDGKPYICCIDGNIYNLRADNLYWHEENLNPMLNTTYAQTVGYEVTVTPEAIRHIKENTKFNMWNRGAKVVKVGIPLDVMGWLDIWKLTAQQAVYTALQFMSKWSFSTYAIECERTGEVFIGFQPMVEANFYDLIIRLAPEVSWLRNILINEGHAELRVRHIACGQTRSQSFESVVYHINRYHKNGWAIVNEDWLLNKIPKQIQIDINKERYEKINQKLKQAGKPDLEKMIDRFIKKLENSI